MIISSVLLCISNMLESMKAGERSENILSSLKSQISSENESPSEPVTPNAEEKSVSRQISMIVRSGFELLLTFLFNRD